MKFIPCRDDVCDGSGMVWSEQKEEEEACPCMKDPWAVEPDKGGLE